MWCSKSTGSCDNVCDILQVGWPPLTNTDWRFASNVRYNQCHSSSNDFFLGQPTNMGANVSPAMSQYDVKTTTTPSVCKWPHQKVPYEIGFGLSKEMENVIQEGITMFNTEVSCIQWVERQSEQNYVRFINGYDKCRSSVGMVGGLQFISIASWAKPGNIVHEMCHAIGLLHEHQRADRDHHVSVYSINPKDINFEIEGTPIGAYDYESISHYPAHRKTSTSIKAHNSAKESVLGQRKCLSNDDIKGIESIYGTVKCSFERYGDTYWMQGYYECIDCWGKNSNYGCCIVCKNSCHKGHKVVFREAVIDCGFVCDCGRNGHKSAGTYSKTLNRFQFAPNTPPTRNWFNKLYIRAQRAVSSAVSNA